MSKDALSPSGNCTLCRLQGSSRAGVGVFKSTHQRKQQTTPQNQRSTSAALRRSDTHPGTTVWKARGKGYSPLAIARNLALPPGLLLLAPHPHQLAHILVLPKLVLQGTEGQKGTAGWPQKSGG